MEAKERTEKTTRERTSDESKNQALKRAERDGARLEEENTFSKKRRRTEAGEDLFPAIRRITDDQNGRADSPRITRGCVKGSAIFGYS